MEQGKATAEHHETPRPMVPGGNATDGVPRLGVGGWWGLFSVEEAICPSLSGKRLVPTGSRRDGYVNVGRTEEETEETKKETGEKGKREVEGQIRLRERRW